MNKIWAALILVTFSGSAAADPVTVFSSIATAFKAAGAFLAQYSWAMAAISIGNTVYQSARLRKKARQERARQIAEHNSGLQDRTITYLDAVPPWKIVYGRAVVGGYIVASFVSDKQSYDDNGAPYTKADGYRHLVIVIATHECEAIHEAYFAGVKIGALSPDGWAQPWQEDRVATIRGETRLPYRVISLITAIDSAGNPMLGSLTISADRRKVTGPAGTDVRITYMALRDDFARVDESYNPASGLPPSAAGRQISNTISFTGSITLPHEVSQILYVWEIYQSESYYAPAITLSPDKKTITSSETTYPTRLTYSWTQTEGKIRLQYHLGAPGQAANAFLMSAFPDKWTSDHTLSGLTYAVVTVDLEDSKFQGGVQELSFDVSGRRVFDPRTNTVAFSRNAALCAADYLENEWGLGCDREEINQDYLIAAANACDTAIDLKTREKKFSVINLLNSQLYTINGQVTTDMSKEAVLDDMAEAMGGEICDSSQWLIMPGVWTAPVIDLNDDDLVGSIEIIQADNPSEGTFNVVRGTYLPAQATQVADFPPYHNETLITADGLEFATSIELPFTDHPARCTNLARIKVEQSRAGLTIKYPASLRAWRTQIGDRVRVTSKELACVNKYFRVTDWQHTLTAPVELILQEDYPSIYDTVDTVEIDPTREITMPNAWQVMPLQNVQINSGTSELVIGVDGTILVRAKVSWDRPTDTYVLSPGARIEIRYLRMIPDSGLVETGMQVVEQVSAINAIWITGLKDGDQLAVKLYAVNTIGVRGEEVMVTHTVVGKSEAPNGVINLAATISNGNVTVSWDNSTDADYDSTEIRASNANWGKASPAPLFRGKSNSWQTNIAAVGSYTWYAVHIDTSGNVSSVSSVTLNVTQADLPNVGVRRLAISPPSATFTVVPGVGFTNTSGANSTVYVLDESSVNVSSEYNITKTDNGTVSTLAGNALTVTGLSSQVLEPEWANVVFMARFNGDFLDEGPYKLLPSKVGSAVSVSATGGPFPGTGCAIFNGDPSPWQDSGQLAYPLPFEIVPTDCNFSLRMWVRFDDLGTYQFMPFAGIDTGVSISLYTQNYGGTGWPNLLAGDWITYQENVNNDSGSFPGFSSSTTTPISGPGVISLAVGVWYFVEYCFDRDARKVYMFLDGLKVAETVPSGTYSLGAVYQESGVYGTTAGTRLRLGKNYEPGWAYALKGALSEVVYQVGGAVHNSNYAKPIAPSLPVVPPASAQVEITAAPLSGGNPLVENFYVYSVTGRGPSISIVLSRASGVVTANFDNSSRQYGQAGMTYKVLVDGADQTSEWQVRARHNGASADMLMTVTRGALVINDKPRADPLTISFTLGRRGYRTQSFTYTVTTQLGVQPTVIPSGPGALVITADWQGNASNLPLSFTMKAMSGATDEVDSYNWSAALVAGSALTFSQSGTGGKTVTLSAWSTAATDSATLRVTGTRPSWPNLVVDVNISRVRATQPTVVIGGQSSIVVAGATDGTVPASSLPASASITATNQVTSADELGSYLWSATASSGITATYSVSVPHPSPTSIAALFDFNGSLTKTAGDAPNLTASYPVSYNSFSGTWGQAASFYYNSAVSAFSSLYDLNATDYTLEARMHIGAASAVAIAFGVNGPQLVPPFDPGSDPEDVIALTGTGSGLSVTVYSGGSAVSVPGYMAVADNSSAHFALTRQGNTVRFFFNGTLQHTATVSARRAAGTKRFRVNHFSSTDWLDSVCLTRSCLYTASFTPPAGPYSLSGGGLQVSVTAMTTNTDIGTITVTGTRPGWPNLTWTITVTKTRLLPVVGSVAQWGPVLCYAFGITTATARVIIAEDGRVLTRINGLPSEVYSTQWHGPTTTGIGATRWAKLTKLSGDDPSSPSLGTVLSLTYGLTITLSRSTVGAVDGNYMVEIYSDSGGTVKVGEGIVYLAAEIS